MELRQLSGTDLTVSRLCFGAMTFGNPVEVSTAREMVSRCIDVGINFFDTANVYQQGMSESMLGDALKGRRQNVILASKVRGSMGPQSDQSGLSRAAIVRAIEESLGRLRTDYLDIYYLHQPDYEVPIEETLQALQELIDSGKVRWIATSNYASWQVCEILSLAKSCGYKPAAVAQQMYNLIARGLEQEFVPFARHSGVSIIAYNPLAGGLLTGKHSASKFTPGTRFADNRMYQDRYWHEQNFEAVAALTRIASNVGRSLLSLAFGWLLHHTRVACVILGASRLDQLDQNLAACNDGPLSADSLQACDEVWNRLRGPAPIYNR
ncbi:MAG TPA: aldo/keto reductase [Terriglobales bacterium]|nr:aldo/keto reductase [Terriglobales bacterium]